MKKGHDICPLFFVSFNIKYHTLPYIMCKIYYTMKHSNLLLSGKPFPHIKVKG